VIAETQAERNKRLAQLRYSLDRDQILKQKRAYYREHRDAIRKVQAAYRAAHPFKSTPYRRAYMRVYMREWHRQCS
jgi:hypothetical protein